MALEPPYPELDEFMVAIGEAGRRLSDIQALEGAAGNISVYIGWPMEPRRKFPLVNTIDLPIPVPELGGKSFLVTGSGRRLREIIQEPVANLGFVVVNQDGHTGQLHTSPRRLFTQLTSEFNSHLAVHRDQVSLTGTNFHAIVHAQPPYLTYLSHILRYQDQQYLNQHILRWQPEAIVNLPEGLGYVPFRVPGTARLMSDTAEAMRTHRVVVWAKHGVIARSDVSVKRAADRIEYAETGAHYEYMNLVNHELGEGLLAEEIKALCDTYSVQQSVF